MIKTNPRRSGVSSLLVGALAAASLQFAVASPDGKSIAINFGQSQPSSSDNPTSIVEGAAGVLGTETWNNPEGGTGGPEPLSADSNGSSSDSSATVTWESNNLWSSTGLGEENNTAPDGNNRNLLSGYLDTNAADTIFVQVDDVPYDVYTVYVYMKGGVIGRGGDYKVSCNVQYHQDVAAFSGEFVEGAGGDYLVFENVSGSSVRIEGTPVVTRAPINGIEIVETLGVTVPTEAPPVPANLAATETGALRAIIGWDASAGATKYEVWQDGAVVGQVSDTWYEAIGLNAESSYTFQVIALDDFCNASEATGELSVTTEALGEAEGFVIGKIYDTGGGASFDDLLTAYEHADFPDNPSSSIPSSGAQLFPGPFGDNYLGLIQFQLVIKEAGNYDFFIRSDDASELYLNTDGPAFPTPGGNDFPIAWEEGCCNPFQEPGIGDQSTFAPIALSAGSYGVTVTWKEGGGGDWVQVAMREENDTTAAASLNPIGGSNIISEFDTVGSFVNITSQPVGGEISENESFALEVGFDFGSPYVPSAAIQWFKDGAAVSGGSSAKLNFSLLQKSDAGTYKVELRVPGGGVESDEVVLTVLDDTKPPRISAGALAGADGKFEIGIGFSEPVNGSTVGDAGNYSISGGTIDSVSVLTRPLDNFSADISTVQIPDYYSAKLVVSGLTAGETYSVTATGVADVVGNAIPAEGSSSSFTADDSYTWSVIGSQEAHNEPGTWVDDAVRVGDDGFDILASGVGFWSDYDEATFVHQEIEGDFDKVAQVEYQDPTSQWARTGLIMREALDTGKGRVPEEFSDCPSPIIVDPDNPDADPDVCIPADIRFSRYQSVHANAAIRWDNGVSNNSYENNYRNDDGLAGGNQTRGANGGGGPLDYPNVWVRIKRVGDTIMTFTGSDGQNWEERTTREFVDLESSVFVGAFYAPEMNNNGTTAGLQHSGLARFRNMGNFGAAPVEPPVEPPVPGGGPLAAGAVVAINFSADEPAGAGSAVSGAAGVLGTVNWNNLETLTGEGAALSADVDGASVASGVTVSWTSNNTWSSAGRSEDNNSAPEGDDRNLMIGYLDTNGADPNSVVVSGLADDATYDVVVYTKGGVIGRGGEYTIGDQTFAHADAAPFSGDYVFGAAGDYLVFKDVSGSSFELVGLPTTGSPARAPINGIEIVIGGGVEVPEPAGGISSFSVDGGNLVIEYTGTLKSAGSVTGPYSAVDGASSPATISADGDAQFYIAD
jgi:hypothetical protein